MLFLYVYLEFYNGNTFISKSVDFNVTKNFDCTWEPITPVLGFTPAGTTKIRVVGYCAGTAIKLDEISISICEPAPTVTLGSDISQCENGFFSLTPTTVPSNQKGVWSVVSGNAVPSNPVTDFNMIYTLPAGQSATLRYTVTNGSCVVSDDIVISNTTGCSTTCVGAVNQIVDLETEGAATNFNLSFQGTPALLISGVTTPPGWQDAYGSTPPNTTTFTGAYYIKKTGASGNPRSGTHMAFLNGFNCFSGFKIGSNVACGKTYKVSAWVAAYTNDVSQLHSSFYIESSFNDSDDILPDSGMTNNEGFASMVTSRSGVTGSPQQRRRLSREELAPEAREAILRAAMLVVGKHGYANATIARVTKVAEVWGKLRFSRRISSMPQEQRRSPGDKSRA